MALIRGVYVKDVRMVIVISRDRYGLADKASKLFTSAVSDDIAVLLISVVPCTMRARSSEMVFHATASNSRLFVYSDIDLLGCSIWKVRNCLHEMMQLCSTGMVLCSYVGAPGQTENSTKISVVI